VNHINEHSGQSIRWKCPPPASTQWSQMVTPALMTFPLKSNQVRIKHFRRPSMSWIFVSYTLRCITPQISKYKARDDPGPLWWSYDTMIHLMQFPLVISRCNITFSVFWLSHGSVATLITWGGSCLVSHVPFISKSISENCIKIRWFLTKLQTKISWLLFMAHDV